MTPEEAAKLQQQYAAQPQFVPQQQQPQQQHPQQPVVVPNVTPKIAIEQPKH